MKREQLVQLEDLLEKMDKRYGDSISNDRYTALQIIKETVCSLIINTSR